ncbi:DUF4386 domain-containing protein [Mobilitalea sibirica]|uniref:DUF4386 domain-containing protein n=1 Tax=Mobilitalea sibirica TaxID=1462919 RepID=A0A8J7HDA2_9FIRM|nr:DUF4386 domain-containing protein [Mobilitalea sibirica]MBH1941827.1 DUF4386 domain-containing protein [Mobilitalea sibirica]
MNLENKLRAKKIIARKAGVFYLIMAIFYSISMIFVDSFIYQPTNVSLTIERMTTSQNIFYIGFICALAGHISFLFLANVLYQLFEEVNRGLARLMVIFIIVGVAIAFLNRVNQLGAFLILEDSLIHAAFDVNAVQSVVMLFLNIHKSGEILAMVFWGLWLLPLAMLMIKSNMMPKVISIMLISAGICYLVEFLMFYLLPEVSVSMDPFFTVIETVAEVSLILWLLIKGVCAANIRAIKHS